MKRSLPALVVLLLAATIALSDPSHGAGVSLKSTRKTPSSAPSMLRGRKNRPVAKNAAARIYNGDLVIP